MKLVNNNISPLAFYDDIALQNHRKSYAFGQVFPLITYKNYLLPFQFVVSAPFSVITHVWVLDYNDPSRKIDITDDIIDAGLIIKTVGAYTLVEYPAVMSLNTFMPEGLYYIDLGTSIGKNYYSEVFCVKNKVDDCILLEWNNSYNIEMADGVIDFESFTFRCYLQTQIGRPEYTFEEVTTERLGYSFVESQVSKKIYKFTFLAPEYLCDALRIIRLCNTRRITQGQNVYRPTLFSIEPKWQEQGDIAVVEAEFETSTVIANLGGYSTNKDFNNDFNNDFD